MVRTKPISPEYRLTINRRRKERCRALRDEIFGDRCQRCGRKRSRLTTQKNLEGRFWEFENGSLPSMNVLVERGSVDRLQAFSKFYIRLCYACINPHRRETTERFYAHLYGGGLPKETVDPLRYDDYGREINSGIDTDSDTDTGYPAEEEQ